MPRMQIPFPFCGYESGNDHGKACRHRPARSLSSLFCCCWCHKLELRSQPAQPGELSVTAVHRKRGEFLGLVIEYDNPAPIGDFKVYRAGTGHIATCLGFWNAVDYLRKAVS